MLEVCVNLLGAILLSSAGFYVIKQITKSSEILFKLKNILLILILSIITIMLHKVQYTGIESFIIFLINILIYKIIFNIKVEESIITVSFMMLNMFISDIIMATILKIFYSVEVVRMKYILSLIANVFVCIIQLILININIIHSSVNKFYRYCKKTKSISNTIFFTFIIISFCILAYNSAVHNNLDISNIVSIVMMVLLVTIAYIFVDSKNKYNNLTDEYDSLFSYIQNFEDWIEKEQLNRHEYKNQLAVLYCLTKEKKVKEKINEILEDNINIGGEVINQLKLLPKGGIKGLIYYKVAIGQKKKINITADVSLENKSILNELTEQEIRVICKLIGIYLDNAIEASEETRKKNILIEVYELSNKVCFVFSNTFKKKNNFEDRNKKGITTKGEGHGNGLYFASKLIDQNSFLESKQDVVDGYYIQQLIIKRKESK